MEFIIKDDGFTLVETKAVKKKRKRELALLKKEAEKAKKSQDITIKSENNAFKLNQRQTLLDPFQRTQPSQRNLKLSTLRKKMKTFLPMNANILLTRSL